ncbi:MAG: pyridoxal-dependent decarboxylase [Pseudomonadota bacterium]
MQAFNPAMDETNLDPEDWAAFRDGAHRLLDEALDRMAQYREGPVWQDPGPLQRTFTSALPREGRALEPLIDQLITSHKGGIGNTHPRFFGWVHGAGTPLGLLSAMATATVNANCGGRDHLSTRLERQIIDWMRSLFGFPQTTQGLLVSGTSMASIIALKAARDRALGFTPAADGVGAHTLVAYTSHEAHSCVARAFDLLGLGTNALRKIPVTPDFKLDTAALREAIDADRAAGLQPFAVIASAGTVNTGAIDPLDDIADVAAENALWLHVDGAFGACLQFSQQLAPRLRGIERAASLAFDFHKWLHVTYDAGCVLVRDGDAQLRAFSKRPDYLQGTETGPAAGFPWAVDLGPELSRTDRALKVWTHLQYFGTRRLGQQIEQNVAQIHALADCIDHEPALERLAPASLNICCFRYRLLGQTEEAHNAFNLKLIRQLQSGGIALPSDTRIGGNVAIRVNLTNHRTTQKDLDLFLAEVLKQGHAMVRA